MKEDNKDKLGKFLSLLLRHKPDILNLNIRNDGFVEVKELVEKIKKVKKFGWVSEKDIVEAVKSDEKDRFEMVKIDGKSYIRARYGHSRDLDIKIDYPTIDSEEIDVLYHGTNAKVLPWILREGLKPMNRKYVHLSPTPEDALIVSKRRRGKSVILKIDAKKFIIDGGKIWRAGRKTFLAEAIPPEYIRIYKYGV